MSGLLKFITCGSVDDGKSTLIGHILYDSKLLYADQEKALVLDSKVGSRGGEIDYSLLLDGLMAEREQGITIDVAYRYFTTNQRSFIVADTPGHEEYTRNMAVGASFAQLAIVMVDAKQGVLVQTRRHARICALMGIRYFVFAVNKMDLVNYSEQCFLEIQKEIEELAASLHLHSVKVIPVSATAGDNVTTLSENTPWYDGESLLTYLENVEVSEQEKEDIFYLPVQRVCRPNHEFRGFQGQAESGKISVGDKIITLPSNEEATVKSILTGDEKSETAFAGQALTIQLDREVDVSRGCVLTTSKKLGVFREVHATILWMDDDKLMTGKEYLVKVGTRRIPGVVKNIDYKIEVNTGEHLDVSTIEKNEIASCKIVFSEKVVVDEFKNNKTLGEFILIDRVSHMTSACGVVDHISREEEKKTNGLGFNTSLLHGVDQKYPEGATHPPIFQSSAFRFEQAEDIEKVFTNKAMGFAYTRISNPTVDAFEQRVTYLEEGLASVACASGMAAISSALLNILQTGDEIVAAAGLYGGTVELFDDFENLGIHTRYVAENEPSEYEKLINEKTRVIFAESIGNPKLDVTDIEAVAEIAHAHNIPLAIDNTVATPYLVKPIQLGADIVIHSSSKYMNGNSNAISGVITWGGNFKFDEKYPLMKDYKKFGTFGYIARLRNDTFRNLGGCLSPQNAFLNIIGLETLGLRMERQCSNALELAQFLNDLDVGLKVNYPGLSGHAYYELSRKQFAHGFGALVTVRCGSKERAYKILNALKLPYILSNIGDTKTLVLHPASTIAVHLSLEEQEKSGVYEDLIRISVGIEDIEDLKQDFKQAIKNN